MGEGIPLVHVPLAESYDMNDVANLFIIAVSKAKNAKRHAPDGVSDSVPMCPIGGKMMVLRIYREGPKAGRNYYGRVDSPRCAGL